MEKLEVVRDEFAVEENPFQEEEIQEEEEVVDEVTDEPEHTPEELEAMSKGWKPDGVEGKPFISAGEFLRNESFFERIFKLERQNKELKSSVDFMADQHKKIAELERKKVLDELKSQKKRAMAEEDYDAVIDIDDQIANINSESNVPEKPSSQSVTNPAYDKWLESNQWYDEQREPALYKEATALGIAYHQMNPDKAIDEVYDYVTNTVQRLYPEKFTMRPSARPAVEGSRSGPVKKAGPKKYTAKDLNDVQRRVMQTYVKRGVMSEAEYIEELVKIGELG